MGSSSHFKLVCVVQYNLDATERWSPVLHLHGPCHWHHLPSPEDAGVDLHLLQGDQVHISQMLSRGTSIYFLLHRDVWKIYLDMDEYERAKQYAEVRGCQLTRPYQL